MTDSVSKAIESTPTVRFFGLIKKGVAPEAASVQVFGKLDHELLELSQDLLSLPSLSPRSFQERMEDIIENHMESTFDFLTDLGAEVERETERQNQLTQFLGVSLRGVLPYAEDAVLSLSENYTRDGEEGSKDEMQKGHRCVTRAQAALNRLENTPLAIKNLDDDVFDDTFEIVFDDEAEVD